jgi:hypothetical protein
MQGKDILRIRGFSKERGFSKVIILSLKRMMWCFSKERSFRGKELKEFRKLNEVDIRARSFGKGKELG